MGNSLSNQTPACCAAGSQDGVMVQVTVGLDKGVAWVRAVRHVPTWVEHPPTASGRCCRPWPTGLAGGRPPGPGSLATAPPGPSAWLALALPPN